MGFLVRFERIVESLMSLVSIVGFASTLLLLYIFLVGPLVALVGLWVVQRYEDRVAIEL